MSFRSFLIKLKLDQEVYGNTHIEIRVVALSVVIDILEIVSALSLSYIAGLSIKININYQ